jgi:hypothetical protein
VLRRLFNILTLLSLLVLLASAALGIATHLFPTSSTKELSPTIHRQTVFENGQILIRQNQITRLSGSIEHSSHTIFKIGFWQIIPWTLIVPILWLRSFLIRRPRSQDDLPNLQDRNRLV